MTVSVYEAKSNNPKCRKPPVNTKLNCPARVTLKVPVDEDGFVKLEDGRRWALDKFERKLSKMTEKIGGVYEGYDKSESECRFRVNNWEPKH